MSRSIDVLRRAYFQVTKSTIERRLLSSEGINNQKLLHIAEILSKVTKSTLELRLLRGESINNYKFLQFLLLTHKLLQLCYLLLHSFCSLV
jgi:hypothetical protein